MDIRVLVLVLVMILSSCLGLSLPVAPQDSAGDQSQPSGDGGEQPSLVTPVPGALKPVPVVVQNVDARILESYPPQVHLTVSGHHGTGCAGEVRVEQWRDGRDITVEIATWVPENQLCPMILRFYEDTIALEGPFEPGTYTIHVNDMAIELTIA